MIGLPRTFRLHGRPGPEPRRRPSPAVKRFMARYIFYLEMVGYAAVSLVALAVVACFFFQVNDVIGTVGDAVPIEPRTESIKPEADALVTQVLVQNHQSVHRGDPLVEVVESPPWISRYLVMRQMESLLGALDTPGQTASSDSPSADPAPTDTSGSGDTDSQSTTEAAKPALPKVTLTPEETQLHHLLKLRLADWKKERAKSPRIVLRSPIDGTVIAPDDLAFKQVNAGDEILKVADLNDLRLKVKLSGDTVADARVGQKAMIKAISPDYKERLTFRGDTVPKGRYFWQKERVTAYGLLDPKIKKIVKDGFKDRKITERDDIPFKISKVSDVEVDADLETRGEGPGVRGQSETAASLTPHPSPLPPGGKPVQADAPAEMALTGKVLEGKHRLNVQTADIPPAVTKKVAALIAKQLRGTVIDAPQEPETDGGPAPEDRLRVEAVRNVQIIAKVKGENAEAKGATKRLKQKAARTALRGYPYEKQSDARQFEATVQITNSPPFLKNRVLELMEQGKQVKAKVDLITGRRPVAFLLLKR
jgi:HlyD family secretion protein